MFFLTRTYALSPLAGPAIPPCLARRRTIYCTLIHAYIYKYKYTNTIHRQRRQPRQRRQFLYLSIYFYNFP